MHHKGLKPQGGGGNPHKKNRGDHWKFWKESLGGTTILFCRRGLKFFSPLRGRHSNSTTTHYLVIFFSAQYPTKYYKSSRYETTEAEHPKRYKNYQNKFKLYLKKEKNKQLHQKMATGTSTYLYITIRIEHKMHTENFKKLQI